MNRRALLAVVATIAVLFAGLGWIAGQRIKSPAEAAAETEPPDPSLITAPVELRELSQRLVVRGTVRSDDETPLEATSVSGQTIITRITKEAGDGLEEGDVAIEVAGRPIFVLEGELPVFRSLIPTVEGPDVRQLEEALQRLGHDPGEVDGVYDGDTADAVEELYREAGYPPVEPTEVDLSTLKAARESVDLAETGVREAQDLLDEASAGPSESERISLNQAVAAAKDALADARAAVEIQAAVREREAAERVAAEAGSGLDTANQRLEQARGGTSPDTGEAPGPEELAQMEEAALMAETAKADADAELARAREGETTAREGKERAIERAKAELALARAQRSETLSVDDDSTQAGLTDAQEALTDAREELTSAQTRIDTQFPAAEIRFLPSLPRMVQTMTAEVGQEPDGSVMNITGSSSSITSAVAASDRQLIALGDIAIMEDDDLGIEADATISFIADSPGGGELASDRYLIRIDPDEELPEEAMGVNFRITIPVTSSGGEVLAVPLAALSAGADGSARVEVERSPGVTELVGVNPGLRAEGFVEIEPIDGEVEEGDRIVVGRDLELPGDDTDVDEPDDGDDTDVDEPDDGDDTDVDGPDDGGSEGEGEGEGEAGPVRPRRPGN